MFQNILVPLDGSELSEQAVAYAAAIAGPLGAKVHLLQVVPLPTGRAGGVFRAAAAAITSMRVPQSEEDLDMARHPVYRESEMASLEAEAKTILMPICERLREQGLAADVAVRFGRPAGGILRYVDEQGIDLIVMCTHGEGGPDPYAYGPTADRVARRATCPVMLIRPAEVSRVLPRPVTGEEDHA